MCGIVGFASRAPNQERGGLGLARDALQHRGPDDCGEWWSSDGRVGLAHRRLSVIDLSPGGHQPMRDTTGELVITFNGEIYNYRDMHCELARKGHTFRTASDTEVILAAYREWDSGCLAHLNGQFAFALFDARKQQLFMARDRAGEKPLFYSCVGGTLRFASELKALMADPEFPRRIDREALDCYLAMGFVPGDRCMLHGVNKLPPAHAIAFDLDTGEAKVWRYWDLPEYAGGSAEEVDETALLSELETLLEDAVRRQLVADVPVGILLSGGVDSSLVTAMAVRANPQVKTFTVRFPGFGTYDETEHARLIARHFHTEHMELEAADTTVDLLPRLAHQFDEPIVDSSMIPTFLVSRLIRQHCTVALGGDGGDELFGGYAHYDRMLWMQRRVDVVPRFVRSAIAAGAERALPTGLKGRNWLRAIGADLERGVPHIAAHFDRAARKRLMGRVSDWPLVAETIWDAQVPYAGDLLQRATRMDFANYLAEDILVKVDRASMLNSLEIRAPLLDYRIVEFAFGKVPSYLKATPTSRKILLKHLCDRVLPSAFNRHRKQGFSIPLSRWLEHGRWLDFFREVLLDSHDGLFDQAVVRRLLDGQLKGRANAERLFSLVLFELWRKDYGVSLN